MAFNVLNPNGTVNPNDLARLALVASDASYAGTRLVVGAPLAPFADSQGQEIPCPYEAEIVNSGYQVAERFQDNATGFKVVIFRNSSTNDVIVAFAGTDGANAPDWWGNAFHYGWNQWTENRQNVFNFLAGLQDPGGASPFTGRIHFAGQSLGGALAQYAAYEFVRDNPTLNKQRLTLTTFNGLGGVAALTENLGAGFNQDLLMGMGSIANYRTPNDIVSRLGEGHLGGDAVYELPFRPGGINPATKRLFEFDVVRGHRIESGFYANLSAAAGWFASARRALPEAGYLLIPNLQRAASFFGNPFTNEAVAIPEALIRLASGVMYAAIFAPNAETNRLIWSLADAQLNAGALSEEQHGSIRRADWGAIATGSGIFLTILSPLALVKTWVGAVILGRLASGFGLATSDAVRGVQEQFGPADPVRLPAEVPLPQSEARFDVLRARLEAAAGSALASVDAEGLAEKLASGAGWGSASLDYVQQTTGKTGAELVALDARFGALMYDAALVAKSDDGAYANQLFQVLVSHFEEAGRKVANSNSDLTTKYANVDPGVFGTTTDFVAYDAAHDALEQAAQDPGNSRVKNLIEHELDTIESAGQAVVIAAGRGANPFDAAGFDPDAYALPNAALAEGSVRTLTAYLPYEAGAGGQRIQFELAGASADKLSVLSYAEEIDLAADGTFTLTVAEGQREVSFGLLAGADVDADETLTLSATLVDAADVATHLEHDEAAIALDAVSEVPPITAREIRGDWAPKPYENPVTGATEYHYDDLGNIERLTGVTNTTGYESPNNLLWGSGGPDHMVIGDYEDRAYGFAGDDAILGSEVVGNIILGGAGGDRVEGGAYANHAQDYYETGFYGPVVKLGDDKIYGGAGDDQLYGETEANVADLHDPAVTATGLPGDWITGGSGNDRIFGSAGDDVLLAGVGADLLVGGAGMDVLLGDEDFEVALQGSLWRVMHANFGDPAFSGFEVGLFPIYNYYPLITNPTDTDPNVQDPYVSYYKNGGGDDVLIGGAGKDILIGQAGADTLYGGDDDDIEAGWEGDDQIYGGEGNDLIAGDFGRYELPSQRVLAANQVGIPGLLGAPVFDGSVVDQAGNDYLDGGAGNDIVWGEGGDDVLMGREGSDTLYGDAGYLPVELQGADLLDGGAGDDMLVAGGGNDRLFGGDGTDSLDGGDGDDYLNGGAGDDFLLAGAGDDLLAGGSGGDQLIGGYGIDRLEGGLGDDTLDGGEGNDAMYGDEGMDQIAGGGGADMLYGGSGEDVIDGGEGNDTIDGGEGIDIVRGGQGDDVYVLDFGYGHDLIEDADGENRIQFRQGITSDLLSAQWNGSTLATTFGLQSDIVSVDMAQIRLGRIDFGDGTTWSKKNLVDFAPHVIQQAGAAGGILQGNAYSRNDLRGLEGDDRIQGGGYDDLLAGGGGADTLDGAGGADRYLFTAGQSGIARIADSDTAAQAYLDWYYGNLGIADWNYRGEHGGTYEATVSGEGGSFVAYFSTYDEAVAQYPEAAIVFVEPLPSIAPVVTRNDTATLEQLTQAQVLASDTVEFGEGMTLAGLGLTVTVNAASAAIHPEQPWHGGGTLSVRWGSGGFDLEVLDIDFGFAGTDLLSEYQSYRLGAGVEAFAFADGSRYTLEQLLTQAALVEVNDYAFARGSGYQAIDATSYTGVAFEAGIAAAEVQVTRDGFDLLLTLSDSSAQGRIVNWFADPENVPDLTLRFAADTEIASAELTRIALTQIGTEGFDYMASLDDFPNTLHGLGGHDSLNGGTGNDTLDGAEGDDTLAGGAGDDAYVFGPGYGTDYVEESGGSADAVRLVDGVLPADVTIERDYGTLLVQLNGGADTLNLSEWFNAPGGSVERIEFGDGTVWDTQAIEAQLPDPAPTPDADTLFGKTGDDAIDALAGDDYVAGYAGDDLVQGGAGDDGLDGGTGNDILEGGEGSDSLEDSAGASLLDGGAGNDYVYQQGRNFVIGGAGDDWIDSYGDGAVIAFNPGDGQDTVYAVGNLTLSIGGGIGVADLTLTRDGDDLVLTVGASDSIRLTRQYEPDPQAWPQMRLQLFGSVHTYDLTAAIDGNIADHHLGDSQSEALGGALAYQYATTGGTDGLTVAQQRSVLADAGFGSAPQPVSLAPPVNHAPVAAAADATVILNEAVSAASLFSVTDADNDAITQYEFWDSTNGNGRFTVNGVEAGVNVSIPVSAADLAGTTFTASASIGSDLVWVRANDGQAWSDWKSWTVYSSPHLTNALPVATASNGELLIGESAAAASLFSVTDADGDAIVQYEFWDDVAGGGHFSLGGISQGGNPIPVSATQLADLAYVAGSSPGTEQVWVRASDGIGWGAWRAWNMTSALHIPNAAPEVSAAASQTVLLNDALSASSLFSVTDADNDAITQYEFWDSTLGNGRFEVSGVAQGVNVSIPVSAADLANTQFVGASSTGSDLVWVRASDGQAWGGWKSWYVNSWPHLVNAAPVASAGDATLLTSEVVCAGTLFSVTDGDGDAIAQYEFWDDVNGGGYWSLDGIQQGAAQTIPVSAADFANTEYVGGASGGTERVWVRANDGLEWGAWKPWNMTTALHIPNAAPVVAAADSTVLLNDVVSASSLFTATDADSDPITQYEFWDSTAGNGHFEVNGVEQGVNVSISVPSSSIQDAFFVSGSAIGSDLVWVRASDGQAWSDWKSWYVNSAPHLTNAAPTVTAANNGLLRGETVSAVSLFSVSDADNDAIAQYQFWDDVNGGGHWSLDGVQQAAGQSIGVSASDLANAVYVGGANPGTEQVWVRASDGIAWGAWKNWLMSTEGGMLRGGAGPDTLNGDPDTPVLEGGAGNDTLNAGDPNSLLSGGAGDDTLNGGAGNDLLAGGEGNDSVATGAGNNVIAFNAGGGADTVFSDAAAGNALSLGGGIGYNDLSLSKNGNDLVVQTGANDSITFKDWYAGKDNVLSLQLILDATNAFDAGSSDPLYNKKVQTFDFRGLVSQFDQALAASPGLTSWAVTNALLQFHLSGADDAALGGDLAYWYGRNNGFSGISLASAQAAIGAPGFGADAQTLHSFSGLQEGLVKLA